MIAICLGQIHRATDFLSTWESENGSGWTKHIPSILWKFKTASTFARDFGVTEWGNRFPVSKRESGENPELYP